MKSGYIFLHRSLLDWEWYTDVNTKTLFLHLLFTVNFEDRKWRGKIIKRGQRVCSRDQLAKETNLSVKQVRVALDHLKETGEVANESGPQGTVITVVNYDKYQSWANKTANEGPTRGQQRANEGPVNNKLNTGNKEIKEKNILKKEKFGEFGNVLMTSQEYEKLVQRFSKHETDEAVEELSSYCQSKGKSYKDYYATLIGWIKRRREKAPKEKPGLRYFQDWESEGDVK